MFRRAFWFTTGAAAGVWATTKVQRKIRSLAPDALAVRAADKAVEGGHRLREFALDVRAGMAQREGELKDALGLDAPEEPGPVPRLPGRRTASLPRQQSAPQQGTPQLGTVHPAPRRDPSGPQAHPHHSNDRNEDH
ncbi:DUF6167 family protein [Streptomyces tubbatahanensis]|uniref:DUF6167 family protein n=1 Tax=Streptomyces tubbatahanensis TaxID=2923272 RepID=A0ABY3XNF8_9ACTN|nr:DUF6167 family protein [Streptomyces tubbatahanensis]UNS95955.1 DUF6167 family protein [Streptomyces tubbatahanensis]